jgi:hypothetical protein
MVPAVEKEVILDGTGVREKEDHEREDTDYRAYGQG